MPKTIKKFHYTARFNGMESKNVFIKPVRCSCCGEQELKTFVRAFDKNDIPWNMCESCFSKLKQCGHKRINVYDFDCERTVLEGSQDSSYPEEACKWFKKGEKRYDKRAGTAETPKGVFKMKVSVDHQGRKRININNDINMTVYKNSFGLDIYHKVVYFPNQTMEHVDAESNLFEVLPGMLKEAFERGRESKRLEIEAFYKKFKSSINN